MLRQTIIEMIEDGKREGELKGRREGRQEGSESGISQVAINMLREKCDKKTIQNQKNHYNKYKKYIVRFNN